LPRAAPGCQVLGGVTPNCAQHALHVFAEVQQNQEQQVHCTALQFTVLNCAAV